jgi:PKD repeat protein
MKKFLFLLGAVFFTASIYAQCPATITPVYQPGGQVDFTISGFTLPPNWDMTTSVNFGDFTSGNYPGAIISHTYTANVSYTVSFYTHFYNTLDTSIYCNVYNVISINVTTGSGYTETCNLQYEYYQHCMDSILLIPVSLPSTPGYYYNWMYGTIVTSAGDTINSPFGINIGYTPWPDSVSYTYDLHYGSNYVCTGTAWVTLPVTFSPYGLDVFVDYNSATNVELNDTSATNMKFDNCDWGDGIIDTYINNYSAFHTYLLDGDYEVIASAHGDYTNMQHPSCLSVDTVIVSITGVSNSLSCNLTPMVFYNGGTHQLSFALMHGGNKVSSPNLDVSWSFDNGMSSTLDFGTIGSVVTPPVNFTVSYSVDDYLGTTVCTNSSTMPVNSFFTPCNALVYIYEDTIVSGLFWAVDQSSGGQDPYTYLWDFGDGVTSTLQFPTHTYAIPDIYNVCLTITDSQGSPCTSTYCDTVDARAMDPMHQINVFNPNGVGIDENGSTSFSLFPNPVSDYLVLNTAENFQENIMVSIYTIAGQLIESKRYQHGTVMMDVSGISDGVYFIKIEDNVKSATRKFIKK